MEIDNEKVYHNTIFSGKNPRDKILRFYDIDRQKMYFINKVLDKYSKGARVLEYGCGVNCSAFNMVSSANDITAIDISDVAVKKNNDLAEEKSMQDRLE